MSMMELGTICQEGLGVKIIIMRNTRLGMVRELQDNLYKGVHSAVYLDGSPDFAKIAEAYGIRSRTVSSNEEAAGALEEMWADDKPYLLVCRSARSTPPCKRAVHSPVYGKESAVSMKYTMSVLVENQPGVPVQGVRSVFPPRLQYRLPGGGRHRGSHHFPHDHCGGRG